MPLHRRLPKRGFTNIFRIEYRTVNVDASTGSRPAASSIPTPCRPPGLLKKGKSGVKVLGNGELKVALTVNAHIGFTGSAAKKIEAAGGKAERIGAEEVRTQEDEARMVSAFKNIWSIPDLRRRVLFTFAMLAVYRIGGHIPTPGIDSDALVRLFERQEGGILGFVDMFSGGYLQPVDDLRAGHHALHHGVDHPAAADGDLALSGEAEQGRRGGRKKITQYTRYGTVCCRSCSRWASLCGSRAAAVPAPSRSCSTRLGLPPDDDADPDHRNGVHHVARRADLRARHRQRNLADHLRRHRRRPARARWPTRSGRDHRGSSARSRC